jgi:hypothetical protein
VIASILATSPPPNPFADRANAGHRATTDEEASRISEVRSNNPDCRECEGENDNDVDQPPERRVTITEQVPEQHQPSVVIGIRCR